jgi:hypothetical protein
MDHPDFRALAQMRSASIAMQQSAREARVMIAEMRDFMRQCESGDRVAGEKRQS